MDQTGYLAPYELAGLLVAEAQAPAVDLSPPQGLHHVGARSVVCKGKHTQA